MFVMDFHSILGQKVAIKKSRDIEWFLLPRLYPRNKKKKKSFTLCVHFLKISIHNRKDFFFLFF
jgi:hypothetical protein